MLRLACACPNGLRPLCPEARGQGPGQQGGDHDECPGRLPTPISRSVRKGRDASRVPALVVSPRRNYGFERRRRALDRQARQEVKRQRKADRTDAGLSGAEIGEAQDFAAPAGAWEWFSPSRSRTLALPRGTRPDAEPPDDWILLTDTAEDAEPAPGDEESASSG